MSDFTPNFSSPALFSPNLLFPLPNFSPASGGVAKIQPDHPHTDRIHPFFKFPECEVLSKFFLPPRTEDLYGPAWTFSSPRLKSYIFSPSCILAFTFLYLSPPCESGLFPPYRFLFDFYKGSLAISPSVVSLCDRRGCELWPPPLPVAVMEKG